MVTRRKLRTFLGTLGLYIGCALVIADTAGRYPYAEEVTTDFVYVRLHGSRELYVSGYTDAELDVWAARIGQWGTQGRDVYVYFDNDAKVHAPFDALRLRGAIENGHIPALAPPPPSAAARAALVARRVNARG